MYFPLPSIAEDRIVKGVEKRMGTLFLKDGRPNPDYSPNRKMLLARRSLIRNSAKKFNRRLHYLMAVGSPEVAGLRKDKAVASELALQEVVRRMSNWQRSQWARMGYPGLMDLPRKPERALPFLQIVRGEV